MGITIIMASPDRLPPELVGRGRAGNNALDIKISVARPIRSAICDGLPGGAQANSAAP